MRLLKNVWVVYKTGSGRYNTTSLSLYTPKSKGGLKVVAYYTTKSEAERKANRLNKKAGFKKIKF